MNALFADWLRDVSIDLAGLDLAARTAAADSLVESATGTDVLRLIALAHDQPHEDAAVWLREPFKQAEPAFPMRGNDAELRVLAAAVLEQICRDGELRLFAAQAVVVAQHRGWSCPLPELAKIAEEAVVALAVDARRPTQRPVGTVPSVMTGDLEEAVEAVAANPQYAPSDPVVKALKEVAVAAHASAAAAMRHADRLAAWADRRADLAQEETALLWWLLSGRSETLAEPWHALPPAVLAIAAGRELASAAALLPAPPQAGALLAQLVAVNAHPKEPVSTAAPAPLSIPPELAFLVVADLAAASPTGADPLALARHSLDQSVLLQAWDELE
jgi:hypothetical protein